jgi:hypothetical protein
MTAGLVLSFISLACTAPKELALFVPATIVLGREFYLTFQLRISARLDDEASNSL